MGLNEIVESNAQYMIASLQELLRIDSTAGEPAEGAPHGKGVQKALDYVLKKAEDMGFRTCDYDHQVGYCEYGRGDLIAVVAHLDVVPAGEGWIHDPFGGDIEENRIYGRGAVDDKGPAIAALYALHALKQSGLPIKNRIRIMFGTCEETGSSDMKYFFEHGGEEPVMGFTPDGAYPVVNGEKGIVIADLKTRFHQEAGYPKLLSVKGGTAFNVVPAKAAAEIECSEEIFHQLKEFENDELTVHYSDGKVFLEAHGVSAHGSTPEKGKNAIGILAAALKEIRFTPELSRVISFLSESIGMETDGKSLGIAMSDSVSGGLTLNLGTIEGNEEEISLCINYRYPVTMQLGDCAPIFNEKMAKGGFALTGQTHEKSLYVDPDSKLVSTLLDVYNEQTGKEGKAFSIGGGTYAKSVRNTVAFGPVFPGDPDREHKPEECIEIENLILNTKIYANAMYRLAK